MGEFLQKEGKNTRFLFFFFCKISRIEDEMGVVATRASRHPGARHPGGETEERRLLREPHPSSFRCFSRHAADAEECNYTPPIRDKDVTREGAATQQPRYQPGPGRYHPRAPSEFQLINIFVKKSLTTALPTSSGLKTFSLCSPSSYIRSSIRAFHIFSEVSFTIAAETHFMI